MAHFRETLRCADDSSAKIRNDNMYSERELFEKEKRAGAKYGGERSQKLEAVARRNLSI